jgi:hypothetical protein
MTPPVYPIWPKFVQIAIAYAKTTEGHRIIALDYDGIVWMYDDSQITEGWRALSAHRFKPDE